MEWLLTAPSWLVAGIIGAIFGAGGAAVGYFLSASGFAWGRFAPVIGVAVGLLVAREGGATALQRMGWNEAATERVLMATLPEFYHYLKDNFGSDYNYLVASATEAVRSSKDRNAAARTAASAMANVRKKYANMVALAPLPELDQLLDQQASFYSSLFAEHGAEVCNNVAINGPIVLAGTPLGYQLEAEMVPQVLAYFQAVAAAVEAPESRAVPNEGDWAIVGDAMASLGATDAQFAALSTLDQSDPQLCPALLLMMKAMKQTPEPSGSRIKANYLAEASSS